MLSRFDRIPARDKRTDRRTDRQNCYINIARQRTIKMAHHAVVGPCQLLQSIWYFKYQIPVLDKHDVYEKYLNTKINTGIWYCV